MNSGQQLLPGLAFRDEAAFADFYAPASIELARSTLEQVADGNHPGFVYLSGAVGTGKSHLLQAVCNKASQLGKMAMYFPLAEIKDHSPEAILDATGHADCLCLDDIDAIAGHRGWEEAIFHLFNQRAEARQPTCFAARVPAIQLALVLADLQSRLASCLGFQLPVLSDAEKMALVKYRASLHAIELSDACCGYIIQRSGRNIADLVAVLERLDKESLAAKRKITVPFIRSVFGW